MRNPWISSEQEALHAATALPDEIFHLGDRGHVRAGDRADLVLVSGDPTADISQTLAIDRIWKRIVDEKW